MWAFDSLYAMANGGPGSGLYRLRDTDGDDQFDEVRSCGPSPAAASMDRMRCAWPPTASRCISSAAITPICRRSLTPAASLPTGTRICFCRVNGTPTGTRSAAWHPAAGSPRPTRRARRCEMFSVGYRNAYRFSFNADGEMFAYDSDMEWDIGTPWYRPTRMVHATSGSEFGWRSGTGKWPAYYVDSLPPMLDIGPGSPVGMSFGYGTRFPAKYQKALFCSTGPSAPCTRCTWSRTAAATRPPRKSSCRARPCP